ncbi:MAG: hypothetical protein PF638_06275 [Candidatus Delongbacteria bacterium]|jgi:hypothetical protein|nr:hypothetical protein [Candidatus Delongbacteria bacterium]
MKNIIILLTTIVLLISCSKNEKNYTVKEIDGIKIYHNTTTPSDPSYKINATKLFTIEGSDENCTDSLRNFSFIRSTVVDSKGNIFILDQKLAEIKKFDKNGKFIKSFCRLGTGPGELQGGVALLCLNDTLYIKDAASTKYSKFTSNGDYIESFMVDDFSGPQWVTPVGTNLFITDLLDIIPLDGKAVVIFDLQIRNTNYELVKSLKKDQGNYIGANTILHDYVHPFCVGKNNIYVAKISENEFLIDVFDFKGNLLYKIRKDFRKIPITEEELNEFGTAQNLTHGENEEHEFKINYKKSVDAMSMFEDKNGNLIVQVPLDRNEENKNDFIVDAFKDGVFLNRFKIDIGRGFDFYNSSQQRFFIGNRIYHQNREESSVTVYEY